VPKPEEVALITVNGQHFGDWETVFVSARYADAWSDFRFTAAERDPLPAVWTKLQLKPDDKCTITLAGQTVITGSIEVRQVAYNADQHATQLIGKSQTVWAAKSSVSSKDGNFDGMTFEQAARKALAPYGVGIKVIGELNPRPFDKLQSQPGEKVWDFLERIARPRGIVLGSDPFGQVLLIGKHDNPITAELVEGTNIKTCQAIISYTDRFGQYDVSGQSPASDDHNGTDASQLHCTVAGGANHPSMIETPAEQPVKSQDEVCERAMFEAQWRESTEISAYITVQGWLYDGANLWEPGQHIHVKSPMAMLDLVMAAQSVTFTQDERGGTETTLELVMPWRLNGSNKVDIRNPSDPDQQWLKPPAEQPPENPVRRN